MKGSDYPSQQVADKCRESSKSIAKVKKDIKFEATGDQINNRLITFLHCQTKATNNNCSKLEKDYNLCHKSFMGMGSYKGRRDCGMELEAWYNCLRIIE
jgi:hypothetical protein